MVRRLVDAGLVTSLALVEPPFLHLTVEHALLHTRRAQARASVHATSPEASPWAKGGTCELALFGETPTVTAENASTYHYWPVALAARRVNRPCPV